MAARATRSRTDVPVAVAGDGPELVELALVDVPHAGQNAGVADRYGSFTDMGDIFRPCGGLEVPASKVRAAPIYEHSLAGGREHEPHGIDLKSCAGDGIAVHIPQQLCRKITQGKYINFALLLKSGTDLTAIYESGGTLRLNILGSSIRKQEYTRRTLAQLINGHMHLLYT